MQYGQENQRIQNIDLTTKSQKLNTDLQLDNDICEGVTRRGQINNERIK